MKAKVLKPFRDKHTKIIYQKGEIIDVTEERFTEIVANLGDGYVEAVPEGTPPKKQSAKKKSKSG